MVAATLSGFTSMDANEANAANAVAAVQQIAPEAVSNVAGPEKADAATAVLAEPEDGTTVAVSNDPTRGVQMDSPGDAVDITIGLPFAHQAAHAAASPETGVVVYNNNNGSSTIPVTHTDGTVQISTVISDGKAPNRYDYPIKVPKGASLKKSTNGVIAVVGRDGSPLRVFGDAWAKDANGKAVPTHYEVRGNTLTQVVNFTEHTAFPVVADPQTTGVYSYNCVLTNGQSVFLKPGEKLTNCKGSFLQKYINGKKVLTVNLVYNGKYSVKVTGAGWCVASLVGTAVLVWNPPAATAVWLLGTASTLVGTYGSCYNL